MYSVRWPRNVQRTPKRGTMTFKRWLPTFVASPLVGLLASPSAQDPSQRRSFPGRRWVAVWLAFPVAGYVGWTVGGRVDAVDAALVGGALTGAGLGAVQWWAAKGALGRPAAWIAASAVGLAAGLAAGAALVGYDTDTGALVLMGVVSGASLGAAQGLVLVRQGN